MVLDSAQRIKCGRHVKDCPDKYKSSSNPGNICLRCGVSGYDMFSCRNDYSQDDIKEIQCYICKSFGHICCINFVDTSPREVSCYRYSQLGHTGLVSFTRYAHILLLELIGRIGSVAGKVVLCQ